MLVKVKTILKPKKKEECGQLKEVKDDLILFQYKEFLKKLELIEVTGKTDSKGIIIKLLNSKKKLYVDIEFIIFGITSACVAFGIESYADSAISTYNLQNSDIRNI